MVMRRTENNKGNLKQSDIFAKIQKRAYELYAKRGASHGNDMRDWLEAERQVKRDLGLR